jgi:hypothetical protein
VRADSVPEARSKAQVIDQDVVELLNCPNYIKTNSYEVSRIKDSTDPVIENAIKKIETYYEPDEPEPVKKLTRRKRKT